ncbi:MAG: hypothetical protein AAF799_30910 [Myxococcota bacterium]
MQPDATDDTRARLDTKSNRIWMLVSLAMASGGITLVVLGLRRDWGFVAVFWSSVLSVLGLGWVVGLLKGGGTAVAACPHCGAHMTFSHIASARTEQCESCGQWSAGTERMEPLAADHVAGLPVFSAPVPEHEVRWPTNDSGMQRCPVCDGPSVRGIELQASSVLGSAFAALSPISIQRVESMRVPGCREHDDGVMLDMDEDDRGVVLLFRSWRYFNDFVALNAEPPEDTMRSQVQPLTEFLQDNRRPVDLRAPETCPMHACPVLTTMGWVSRMDLLPSGDWMDDAARNPVCLELGHHVDKPRRGNHDHQRVAWCPQCEAGMAQLQAARHGT